MFSQRKIESILLWGAKLPLFLLPFIPLIVIPDLIFPYISGKNFAFRIIIEFSLAMYIPLSIGFKEYRPSVTPILLSILFFTFIVGIADLFGVNPYKSFLSNYERMEGYITLLHLTLLFILLQSLFKARKDWKIFFNLFVLCSVIVSIYTIINPIPMKVTALSEQYVGRFYGTLGNPPFLASYLILIVFLGFMLICTTKRRIFRLIYTLAILLDLIVIYFTASRAAILGVIGGVIFFLIAWFYLIKGDLKKSFAVIILFVIISSVLLILINEKSSFITESRIYQRFANISSDPSVMSRVETWRMAWNAFEKRPILGWGQENFIAIYTVNKLPFTSRALEFMDRAHNIFIDWIINAGIIGLISFLTIFFLSFNTLYRRFRGGRLRIVEYITLLTAFLVYFIQNLFTFDTISTYLIIYTLFAYVDTMDNDKVKGDDKKKTKYIPFILIVTISLFLYTSYFLNFKPAKQGFLYRQILGSRLDEYPSYEQLLTKLNNILSYKSLADSYIRRQMIYISTHIVKKKRFNKLKAEEFINRTLDEAEKELQIEGENLEKASLIIKFYYEIAKVNPLFIPRLESLIKNYMTVNPGYEWLYFELADVYFLKGDYEASWKVVKDMTAKDLFNEEKQFKLLLASIFASKENDIKKALDVIKMVRVSKKNMKEPFDRGLYLTESEIYLMAQAYLKKGRFLNALEYYNKLITLSPRDALYHFDTAMIYLAIGDKEMAVRVAKKASELDPINFRDKVEKVIKSIKNRS